MTTKVSREQAFSVLATNFSISPSTSGYTLQISADGINYTNLFAVGANVTRMVTGVASGSYYKLAGNTDTDIIVNWQAQCNDGGSGGSGSQGPEGPQGPQGPIGPQGPQGADGIDQNPTVLKSVAALPESAETGDVVALASESEGLPLGTTFEERNDLGENQDKSGGRFSFPVGAFDGIEEADALYIGKVTTPNSTELSLYIYGNEWRTGGAVFKDATGDFYISMGPDSDSAGENTFDGAVFNYQYTSPQDEYMVVDIYPETSGEVVFDIPEGSEEIGVYQYDGTNWNELGQGGSQGGVLVVNSLSSSEAASAPVGSLVGLYKAEETSTPMEVNLYMKVSGGTVAYWQGYRDSSQSEPFEIIYDDLYDFTSFCDGKLMFTLRYSSYNRYAYMDAASQAIICYSDSGKTTETTRINYLGGAVQVEVGSSSRYVYANWKEDGVYFYNKTFSVYFENLVDFHTEGVHFSRITDPTKATASELGLGNSVAYGIPLWNNEGIIVGKEADWQVGSNSYVNTTSTSSAARTNFVYRSNYHFPERIWVPTTGGNQGQMLISSGDNAAPVWTNWIKSMQITSAAYEALVQAGTTDPNTLYLIVDE